MNKHRRTFLLTASALAAGAAAAGLASRIGSSAAAPQPLRIPPLIDARKSFSLTVQAGSTEFFPGHASATLGYNGSYLGPTLLMHRGDTVQASITNALDEDTTLHWHGLIVPGEVDGGPHQVIRPGSAWRPALPIRQPAATLFYHSHVHERTAAQVYRGLAGVLIVTDEEERLLGLPSEYGVDDLPLVLQDREFDGGRLVLPTGMMTMMQGRRGDTLLVNGTPNAVAQVPARRVRLRFVNGSNARIYDLSFSDARIFHWIASEGGLLGAPVAMRSLSLAPGERAEILVDFSDSRPAVLITGPDPNVSRMMGMMRGMRSAAGTAAQQVLAFEPHGAAGGSAPVPSRLVEQARIDEARATRRRRFVLEMGMGGRMGPATAPRMPGGGMGSGMSIAAINGRAFDMNRIDEQVRLGDAEIWEISGEMMAHPVHIHGVHFTVLRRNGLSPSVRDQGLRDTVLVQEPVELLVQFTQPADKAPFMYHCHILEHEDNGMMGQFKTSST